MILSSPGALIGHADVESVLHPTARTKPPSARPFREQLQQAQVKIIRRALHAHDYNMADAARELSMERSHLHKKCRALGLLDEVRKGREAVKRGVESSR